jgi:hypothetical protein
MKQIKLCPFCNNKVEITICINTAIKENHYYIECNNCTGSLGKILDNDFDGFTGKYTNKVKLINDWNNRII